MRIITGPARQAPGDPGLQVSVTSEAITFARVGPLHTTPWPRAASAGALGMQYVREVVDAGSRETLCRETGIWLDLAGRLAPAGEAVLALHAVLPEVSVLAEGAWQSSEGAPEIALVSTTPIELQSGEPAGDGRDLAAASVGLPEGLARAAISDPNSLLRERIAHQRVRSTTTLAVSSGAVPPRDGPSPPGAMRSPASVALQATLWIETLTDSSEPDADLHQLQYSRRLLRAFGGVGYPEVSLATLSRS